MVNKYVITPISSNRKTGPIMVASSTSDTCPDACGLKNKGCYAQFHHTAKLWAGLDATAIGKTFKNGNASILVHGLDALIAEVGKQMGKLWRFNVFGDLPGIGDQIDWDVLSDLVIANHKARAKGFTYTHKPILGTSPYAVRNLDLIETANARGFCVNLSADNENMADTYFSMKLPTVSVLPQDDVKQKTKKSPEGNKIVICPATRDDSVQCATCGLCAIVERDFIIGFPAHGAGKAKISVNATRKVD